MFVMRTSWEAEGINGLSGFCKRSPLCPLPLAAGAWTSTPQRFKGNKAFAAIFPFHGQFMACAWISVGCAQARNVHWLE